MNKSYLRNPITVTLSGEIAIYGILLEIGSDLLVLYNGKDYVYLPLLHIQRIAPTIPEDVVNLIKITSEDHPITSEDHPIASDSSSLSFRKILQNSKGLFTEIFAVSNQTMHGYVIHIMNNYFVFYSPVYKTIYIPFQHVKWIIPYPEQQTPYHLTKQELPLQPSNVPLARTFEEQLKKFIDKIVVFDLGHQHMKIGKLVSIQNNFVELVVARNETIHVHLSHIKTVHCP
ncbi:hypothetical protein [Ectobacillus panaciterrae]|uniref:hypothetical protein n=1 Tax=Ectobacillus panaciterrae TaxID=363872 RepID=UPI00041613EA|nr:hypothetical protein [Ectobacillus panaciterrae]